MSKTTAKKLFYRISPANEGLVFAGSADAEKNHTIRTAIESSKTWGEFRRAVGNDEYLAVLRAMQSLDDDEPVEISSDKDRFDCEKIPGYLDGDYPNWLQARMHLCIPEDILEEFGERQATGLNGDYFHIEPSLERQFVSGLKKRGYQVKRREDLLFY